MKQKSHGKDQSVPTKAFPTGLKKTSVGITDHQTMTSMTYTEIEGGCDVQFDFSYGHVSVCSTFQRH